VWSRLLAERVTQSFLYAYPWLYFHGSILQRIFFNLRETEEKISRTFFIARASLKKRAAQGG
jgi:hypothetical protein